jgi:dynein light chain roadblock-type
MATNVAVSEVEETMARIKSHKGVEGVVIMTKEGKALDPRSIRFNCSHFQYLKQHKFLRPHHFLIPSFPISNQIVGAIIQSSLSEDQSKQHAALITSLTEKASLLVETLDPNDELNFLRVRTKKKEIMVAPDNGFLMMVIQNPNAVD